MTDHPKVLFEGKQEEIAHSCALTVITDPRSAVRPDALARSLRRSFPAACSAPAAETRYDLLAVADLDEVADDGVRFELLVEDVRTAISLHRTEYLAIITEEATQARLLEKLRGVPELAGVTMGGCRVPSSKTAGGGLLALTCMDWRLHGRGGFIESFRRAFGDYPDGLLTIPGAAKDLNTATVRGRTAVASLYELAGSGFDRLVLVSHTDCGKYGGCAAFAGAAEEAGRLAADLRRAAAFLRIHLEIEIGLGVAEIRQDRTERITSTATVGDLGLGSF